MQLCGVVPVEWMNKPSLEYICVYYVNVSEDFTPSMHWTSVYPKPRAMNTEQICPRKACSWTYPGNEKKNEKIGINNCPTYAASSCNKMKTSTIIVFLNTA